ncbi:MAG: MotA/TolQ/ExbB proton channel family protein [Calditrichaeota bacterium]|nr:MotA/TolQ/ExbB proton channel family protein [Calditrichota bacterium]
MNILEILAKGGWVMILIALSSIAILAIFIERFFTLRSVKINARTFILHVKNLLLKGQLDEAVKAAKLTPGPVAAITKSALEKYKRPKEEIKEAIETAGRSQIYHLEKYLGALATLAAITPMLGFLGTVTGMIRAFMKIEALGGNVGPGVLAGGIWEALVTTAAGLLVGIVAIIFYNYLQGQVERLVFEMEDSSNELLEMVREEEA